MTDLAPESHGPGVSPNPPVTAAANPYREPTERERQRAQTIVGRIVTAFGLKVIGGDERARESGEWVVAGYPWEKAGGWKLDEAAMTRSGPWSKGIIDQTLGEPVLGELCDNPINPETLDPHSRWVEHKIHRVVWRHAFTDHDCQFTGCLSMMLAESQEMRDLLVEAYERGRRDASGAPWKAGEYAND